ncbi:MAG: peptidase S41 [Pedobacter sp.]|nr:MAG: peptidase S41 [Pedobacter sp.]
MRLALVQNVGRIMLIMLAAGTLVSCGTGKSAFSATTKYAPEVLQSDFDVYQQMLEEAHPGLYWYTPKDSMDLYFNWGRQQLKDSLTEPDFRRVLNYVTSKINCGHTSVRASKKYTRYLDTVRISRVFPLSMKIWKDTAVIAANLNRRDSTLVRGTVITGINGQPMQAIIDTLFNFIPTDGYNTTHKYQTLSNRGSFGSLYTAVFGFSNIYEIKYLDSTGAVKTTLIKPFYPGADTAGRAAMVPVTRVPQPSRKERKNIQRNNVRLLKVDSTNHVAMMDLNSFGRGYGLKPFFRRSFKALRKLKINHLIIDVRGNGGGSVTNSTLITRFLTDHQFKVGDSLYAITKRKTYGRYVQNDFLNRLFMTFFSRKKRDGLFHFSYFERHSFKAKKANHFYGKTYILTGGNSFSATTLFTGALREQENVIVVDSAHERPLARKRV